jgi:shikimate kinase
MSKFKRIFIVGQPGAGKGLLAKTLAEKLGWQFIDADIGIEFRIGRMIGEIIGNEGAEAYQQCQNEILKNILTKENIVVTTDVSVVCDEANRKLLSNEFTVFVQVSTTTQLGRHLRSHDPLLLIADLGLFLNKLHQERDHLFEDIASLTISSDDNELEKHILTIMSAFLGSTDEVTKDSVKISLNKQELILFHKKSHTPVQLSEQQAICLKLLSQGKASKEIAREMNISHRTVEGHIKNMMEVLGCDSSKELISLYFG